MIRAINISKNFNKLRALRDVSFSIAEGEVVGFLGQNGAGKTTLMRIIASYLPATSGTVSVAGFDAASESLSVRRHVGYLPENPPLYFDMPVRAYLKFAAQLREIPAKEQTLQVDRVVSDCDLKSVEQKTIRFLSKGFKQRVGIAQAIIHEPKVLLLDEPTVGLDPVQLQKVRKLIKDEKQKRTVILSTHILQEIEQLAQRVLILKEGSLICDQPLNELIKNGKGLEDAFLELVA